MLDKLKAQAEEAKKFIVKYQAPIAAVTAAGLTYAMMRDQDRYELVAGVGALAEAIRDLSLDNLHTLTLVEFIDSKDLREEFFKFDELQNGALYAQLSGR